MPTPKTTTRKPARLEKPSRSRKDAEIIADALLEVAKSLDRVANQIKYLGNGDSNNPMGAIELLGKSIKDAIESHYIGDGLRAVADAIGDLNPNPPSKLPPAGRCPSSSSQVPR